MRLGTVPLTANFLLRGIAIAHRQCARTAKALFDENGDATAADGQEGMCSTTSYMSGYTAIAIHIIYIYMGVH